MPVIHNEIHINAPVNQCFDLARDVMIHTETTSKTKEKIVAGIQKGLMEQGDTVTWEAIHFGVKQHLTAQIVELDKPHKFVDVMVKGAFHSFTHTHEFRESEKGTVMKDTFSYQSPFGILGKLADQLFLERYMTQFIAARANELKRIAEKNK